MNNASDSPPTPDTAELRAALEQELSTFYGRLTRIAELRRSPSSYRSSFGLEELGVVLEDGTQLALMFKNLSPRSFHDAARRAKPDFLRNPLREIEAYELILPVQPFETATLYGAVVAPQIDRYWLFLEKVPGIELYQVGTFDSWRRLAGYLARFHGAYTADRALQVRLTQTLRYDGAFYHIWLRRARAFLSKAALPTPTRRKFDRLTERYDEVIDRLLALPCTVIHGEFFPSNILVQETTEGLRLCPVDWEMAALAPGLIDLAALVAGSWSEAEKLELAMAYYESIADPSMKLGWPPSEAAFLTALDCCRLHVAVQWLGWSNSWSPPPEHAQDWLAEALRLAKRLGL